MLATLLAVDFTLIGLGALCSGIGSLLTAIVGMRMSLKKGREEARDALGGNGDEPRPGGDDRSTGGNSPVE